MSERFKKTKSHFNVFIRVFGIFTKITLPASASS